MIDFLASDPLPSLLLACHFHLSVRLTEKCGMTGAENQVTLISWGDLVSVFALHSSLLHSLWNLHGHSSFILCLLQTLNMHQREALPSVFVTL